MENKNLSKSEYLDFVEKKFKDCFSNKGYIEEPAVNVTSKIDPTVDFIGSNISPLKKYLESENYGEVGRYIVQECMKFKSFKYLQTNIPQKFGCYYRGMGIIAKPDLEKTVKDTFDYLTDEKYLDISPENLCVKISATDEDLIKVGIQIKERVKRQFGFTVNVGVSDDKILAKIASDFEKPDKIHTLFKSEIRGKLWPLPVSEMFLVGKKSIPKLNRMGVRTVGELANTDKAVLIKNFGKYGYTIWKYANGESGEEVNYLPEKPKGIGNSITLPYDVASIDELDATLVELVEKVAYRLRKEDMLATVVNVQLKNNNFNNYSHQKKLLSKTDSTNDILKVAKELLRELFVGEPIRLIGVRVDGLVEKEEFQLSIFDIKEDSKNKKLDNAIDQLKEKFGYDILTRASELKRNNKDK